MTKHEYDLKMAVVGARRFELTMGFATHLVTLGTVLGAIYLIMKGLQPLVGQSPEAINAFAELIKAINFSNVTGYLVASIAGGGWYYERQGKQRAIKEKAHYQKIAETTDPYHPSSGLTEVGGTPKEEAQ